MVKHVLFIVGFVLFTACGPGYGHQVQGGELTVYYSDVNDKDKAEAIAKFWRANDLITGENQAIQLVRNGNDFTLNLIAKDPENAKNMSFDERKTLLGLQENVRLTTGMTSLEIVICDNEFKRIYSIN